MHEENLRENLTEDLPKMTHAMNNCTPYTRDKQLANVQVALLAVIFTVTVVGNILVLVALLRVKNLCRLYYFIFHLCIADLITGLFSMLPQLGWKITFFFVGGNVLCKIVKFIQTLGPYLYSNILVVTALDRYWAICSPIEHHTSDSRRAKIMVEIAWATSLACSIPQACIWSVQMIPGKYKEECFPFYKTLWGETVYLTWCSMTVYFIPLAVLVYTYYHICREIWKSDGNSGVTSNMTADLISRAKVNSVKQMVIIIVLYIISTPFIFITLWQAWPSEAASSETVTMFYLLFSLNSCVNPWIYFAYNKELFTLLLTSSKLSEYTLRNKQFEGHQLHDYFLV